MLTKKLVTLTGAGTLLAMSVASAFAASISADYHQALTTDGDEDIVGAFNLYDLAVGATLIQALPTNIGTNVAPAVGDKFTGYYESYVTSHQLNGVVQSAPGLNTSGSGKGYELTALAQFEETVTSIGPGGYTSSITGGTASIFFDTTPDYNFVTGTGFGDGEAILSGAIVGGGAVSVPALLSGFAQIDIAIDSLNSAIFAPDVAAANGIFTLDLRSNAINGVTSVNGHVAAPGDLLLGADGNLQLQAVPIPAALWLLGSSVIGLTAASRRRLAS